MKCSSENLLTFIFWFYNFTQYAKIEFFRIFQNFRPSDLLAWTWNFGGGAKCPPGTKLGSLHITTEVNTVKSMKMPIT